MEICLAHKPELKDVQLILVTQEDNFMRLRPYYFNGPKVSESVLSNLINQGYLNICQRTKCQRAVGCLLVICWSTVHRQSGDTFLGKLFFNFTETCKVPAETMILNLIYFFH